MAPRKNTTEPEKRPMTGFPGYSITDDGRVWSTHCKPGRWMSTPTNAAGYPVVPLTGEEWSGLRYVHELVAAAFIGGRPEGHQIQHIDGDRANNRVANLRYATRSEIQKSRRGVAATCPANHPVTDENADCATCRRASFRRQPIL